MDLADQYDLTDILLGHINAARSDNNVGDLQNVASDVFSIEKTSKTVHTLVVQLSNGTTNIVDGNDDESERQQKITDINLDIVASLKSYINTTADVTTHELYLASTTHLEAKIIPNDEDNSDDDSIVTVSLSFYRRYLDLEENGPIIDGDLVIQGTTTSTEYGPALCVIEYCPYESTEYSQIGQVHPWLMMFSSQNNEDEIGHTYAIPVSIPLDYQSGGTIRLRVYASLVSNIPYQDETPDGKYELDTNTMILALDFTVASSLSSLDADNTNYNIEEIVADAALSDFAFASSGDNDKRNGNGDDINIIDNISIDNYKVVTSIKVASDYDDIYSCESEGYELNCVRLSDFGSEADPQKYWKSHVMGLSRRIFPDDIRSIAAATTDTSAAATSGIDASIPPVSGDAIVSESGDDTALVESQMTVHHHHTIMCIDDVDFVQCHKSVGELPTVSGYHTHTEVDLSGEDSEHSVYIVSRSVPFSLDNHKLISKVTMVSFNGSIDDHPDTLEKYLMHNITREYVIKQAPADVCTLNGGFSALIIEYYSHTIAQSGHISNASDAIDISNHDLLPSDEHHAHRNHHHHHHRAVPETHAHHIDSEGNEDIVPADSVSYTDNDALSYISDQDNDANDAAHGMTEEQLLKRLQDLMQEKEELVSSNALLQKKAVALYLREKAAQVMNKTSQHSSSSDGQNGVDVATSSLLSEKTKRHHDILDSISSSRSKLHKQEQEFDLIALDLQTKLDDKEFKACEISDSFKEFKKEILSKAVNSSTGKPISKALIKSFDAAESSREEELEKVRLKNITMRITLKKIERVLKAREQVADGLHAIDFEQLKIENQTLNEKIEDRNESLNKLKRKKTVIVQVLTHLREKVRYVESSNNTVQEELNLLEDEIVKHRSGLTVVKKDRDVVKTENKELKRRQGFATNDLLLHDYEKRKGSLISIKASIQECKDRCTLLQSIIIDNQRKAEVNATFGNGLLTTIDNKKMHRN